MDTHWEWENKSNSVPLKGGTIWVQTITGLLLLVLWERPILKSLVHRCSLRLRTTETTPKIQQPDCQHRVRSDSSLLPWEGNNVRSPVWGISAEKWTKCEITAEILWKVFYLSTWQPWKNSPLQWTDNNTKLYQNPNSVQLPTLLTQPLSPTNVLT